MSAANWGTPKVVGPDGWDETHSALWLTWWHPSGAYAVNTPREQGVWKWEVLDNASTPAAAAYPSMDDAVRAVARLVAGIDRFSAE